MPEVFKIAMFISLGFILLLIELLTPGFGLTGMAGILFLIIGCYTAYLKLNIFWGILTSILSIAAVIGFFKIFSKSPIWKKIRLNTREEKKEGFTSAADLSYLVNKSGVSLTALRPSGTALIEGKRIDVIAESMFIERGRKIKVIGTEGSKVIVKEVI